MQVTTHRLGEERHGMEEEEVSPRRSTAAPELCAVLGGIQAGTSSVLSSCPVFQSSMYRHLRYRWQVEVGEYVPYERHTGSQAHSTVPTSHSPPSTVHRRYSPFVMFHPAKCRGQKEIRQSSNAFSTPIMHGRARKSTSRCL